MPPQGFNYQGFDNQGFSFNPPPSAPPPIPVLNQHQLNAYKTLLDLSSPQERQQRLQELQQASGNNAGAAQLHSAFGNYDTGQTQQGVYHNDFATNLTNYAEQGGIGGTIYNNFVQPVVNTASSIPGDLQHTGTALGIAGGSFLQGQHGDQLEASKQAALNQLQQTSFAPFVGKTVAQNNAMSPLQQFGGIAGHTAQNVMNVYAPETGGSIVANLAERGIGGAIAHGAIQGGVIGAGYGLSNSAVDNQWSPGQVAGNVGSGAAFGAILGGAIGGAGGAVAGAPAARALQPRNLLDAYKKSPLGNQEGFIGGTDSASFADRQAQNLTHTGLDGLDRTRYTDINAQVDRSSAGEMLRGDTPQTLSKLLPDKTFAKEYGHTNMGDMPVRAADTLPGGVKSLFDEKGDLGHGPSIYVSRDQEFSDASLRKQLVHERDHVVQAHENFARGTMPNDIGTDPAKYRPSTEHLEDQAQLTKVQAKIDKVDQAYGKERSKLDQSNPYFPQVLKALNLKYDQPQWRAMRSDAQSLRERIGRTEDQMRNDPERIKEAMAYNNSHGERAARITADESHISQERLDATPYDPTLGKSNVHDLQISQKPGMAASDGTANEPKRLDEQIGRLKAAIAKEPDPNAKVELTNQLKGLNKQYSTEKNAAKGTTNPNVMADTLGLSEKDRRPTNAISANEKANLKSIDSAKIMDGTEGKSPEQLAQDAARMEAMQRPTKNKVDLTPGSGGVKSAIANSQMVRQELGHRADVAFNVGRSLSKADRKLADNYEQGQSIQDVAAQGKNPDKLAKALTKLEDYYDYKLAAERAAGAQVPKVNNYARHFWDLSNKADQERFDALANQQGLSKFQGTSSQPRVFKTYAEGEAAGFKRQNESIFHDLAQDSNITGGRIERAALKEGILRAGGEEVSTKGSGVDAEGKPFVNSNINGLNGLSYSKKIANQLKGYNELDRNVFGKSYDKLNSFQKNVVLSLSLFHSMNISLNFAGAEGFSHPFVVGKGLGQSALGFVSPKYAEHVMQGFKDRGVTEWAQRNGIAVGSNHDINPEGLTSKIGGSKWNPITQGHKAIFEREIPIMTLHMAELAKKSGIEAGSTEGIKLGQEINNVMGLMNQKIMARNPNDQKWLNRVMLAPAFTETKYRTLLDAGTKWGGDNAAAGNLARKAVIGKTALEGLIGIAGGIIATGQFPTLQAALSQAVDPYIPTDIKNKAVDANGNHGTKGAFLPHSFTSELSDPLTKLAHGDTSGVVHYANARLSPNLAAANRLLTNQDYFGNPIFDPSKPIAPQIAGQAVKQVLPIGAQNATDFMSGKKGLEETALNEAGLRVKNDPNNPINKLTADYFQQRTDALNGLTANQKDIFKSINPASKNPDGTYTPEATFDPQKAPSKTLQLLGSPEVLAATIKMNVAQTNHDPMWDLNNTDKTATASDGTQTTPLQAFMNHQVHQGTDYGGAQSKEDLQQNPWIKDVNTDRSKWFQTLPATQNPDSQNPLKYPTIDPATQNLMTQETQITDPKAKSAFFKAHPEVSSAYQQIADYTNAKRTQENATPFAQAPVASPYAQQQMDAGNFKDPQVQQFLNANAAFKISGPFGDGIGGGGGGRNTPQNAINNVSQGLQANGKPTAGSSAAAASANRRITNAMKSENRNVKYALKQSRQNVHKISYGPQSMGKSHLAMALMKGLKTPKMRNVA